MGEGVLAKRDMDFGLLFLELTVRAFLMSKYVLFKETNKQSKTTNSSGFYSFVLNTNKQKERGEVVISAPSISNASSSTARGVWMVLVTIGPTGLVPTVIW